MRMNFEAELKGIAQKPIRKGKSRLTITLTTESFNPGEEFRELMNMHGKTISVSVEGKYGDDDDD